MYERTQWVALAIVALGLLPLGSAHARPDMTQQDLFVAGTGGYAHYRIPGIVATGRSTLLAYCEARRSTGGDWGETDILLRRSEDGGDTWEPPVKLASPPPGVRANPLALAQGLGGADAITMNNPVAIVDQKQQSVHFVYCVEYERCFVMTSRDEGRTFSAPVEITAAFETFRPEYDWKVLATGPGHGIQLASGRLLVPVWLSTGTGGHAHRPSAVSVITSDDHGTTWQRGEIVVAHPELVNPSETAAIEREQGGVLLNIRHESEPHLRAVSSSADGRTGWSPVRLDEQLPEPVCFGSLARLSTRGTSDRNRMLFVNPDPPGGGRSRRNLTVRLSYDEGQTWPVARVLEPGSSAYADLCVDREGTISCFYERGTPSTLRLARFDLEWLSQGEDSLPRKDAP